MSEQRTYDWIGQTQTIRRPDISDEEVARQVRMLSPSDLNHEMVCLLGRDRIMALKKELTAAQQRVAELEAENRTWNAGYQDLTADNARLRELLRECYRYLPQLSQLGIDVQAAIGEGE